MKTIDAEQLRQRMDRGDIVLYDVRGDEPYREEHIDGAKTAPHTALRERLGDQLDTGTDVAIYCDDENACQMAANSLETMGFTVFALDGGLHAWKSAGFATIGD